MSLSKLAAHAVTSILIDACSRGYSCTFRQRLLHELGDEAGRAVLEELRVAGIDVVGMGSRRASEVDDELQQLRLQFDRDGVHD